MKNLQEMQRLSAQKVVKAEGDRDMVVEREERAVAAATLRVVRTAAGRRIAPMRTSCCCATDQPQRVSLCLAKNILSVQTNTAHIAVVCAYTCICSSVFLCVYLCVYPCVCIYVCPCVCIYVCVCVYLCVPSVCIYVCLSLCVYLCVCLCVYMCLLCIYMCFVLLCVSMCVCPCVYLCVCLCVSMCGFCVRISAWRSEPRSKNKRPI